MNFRHHTAMPSAYGRLASSTGDAMIKDYNAAAAFFEETTGQRIDPDTDTITIWETTGPATIMTVSRNGAQLRAMYLGFSDPIVLES